jgi:hypothetical protein
MYFIFQYSLIVSLEEEYLIKTFGEHFVRYCAAVPRFLPKLKKYTEGTHEQPQLNWRRGIRSEKRTFQAIGLLATALVFLWRIRG